MKQNDLFDKALDELLYYAAPAAEDEMLGKLPDDPEEPEEPDYSPQHRAAMERLFRNVPRRNWRRSSFLFARRAAVILVAAIMVAAGGIFSVDAWRLKFLSFFTQRTDVATQIHFREEDGGSMESAPLVVGAVTFGYLPGRFSAGSDQSSGGLASACLSSEDVPGQSLQFRLDSRAAEAVPVSGEAIRAQLEINGMEAVLVSNGGQESFLVWYNDAYLFTLTATGLTDQQMIDTACGIAVNLPS